MADNAYLLRLKQLRDQKVADNEQRVGLVKRPGSSVPGMGPQGPGPQQPQQEQDEGPDMNSMFGRNIQSFSGQDKRFDEFFKQYTQMAEGLKEQVNQGYMPMPIAEQRLQQYLNDSMQYFSQNEATPMDNPEIAAKIEGLMGQAMQGQLPNQQPAPPAQAMAPQEQGGM